MNGLEFYYLLDKDLDPAYAELERKNILRSILVDLANLRPPWVLHSPIPQDLLEICQLAVKRINDGEPLVYVTGWAPFRNMLLQVDSNVLIPRPETEELVSLMLRHLPSLPKGKGIDIGTGSGAIALCLAREGLCDMDALDVSEDALAVTARNAKMLGLTLELIKLDILSDFPDSQYAFIISNPPYIPHGEKDFLDFSVREYEPPLALFVPDADPLVFYRRIGSLAKEKLIPGGGLFVECHPTYAIRIWTLFKELGISEIHIEKDLCGKDRMIWGIKK